jgi:hypothetical protein
MKEQEEAKEAKGRVSNARTEFVSTSITSLVSLVDGFFPNPLGRVSNPSTPSQYDLSKLKNGQKKYMLT